MVNEPKVMIDAFDDILDDLGIELNDQQLINAIEKIKLDMDNGIISSESLDDVFNGKMPRDLDEFKECVKDYLIESTLTDEGALDKIRSQYKNEENFNNLILDVLEDNKHLKDRFRKRDRRKDGLYSIIKDFILKGTKLSAVENENVDKAYKGDNFDKDLFEKSVLKYVPANLKVDESELEGNNIIYKFDGILHPSKIYGIFNFKNGKPFAFIPGIDEEIELNLIDEDGASLIVINNSDNLHDKLNEMLLELYKSKLDYINYSNFKVSHWGSDN